MATRQLPYLLGPYQLIHEIGGGGFASIYLALKDNKPFIVKQLKQERERDHRAIKQFIRELWIATHLSHPNILPMVDSGQAGSSLFGVMDFSIGTNLDAMLVACSQQIPIESSLYVIRQIGEALRYLHRTTVYQHSNAVVFHGDVSPENILITDQGEVKLLDFGSAGQESFSDEATFQFGKYAYLPPEVFASKAMNPQMDVYSLAVTAFQLIFGKKPFEGGTKDELVRAIREKDIPRLPCSSLFRSAKHESQLRIIFNRALNKNQTLRYPSVDEFLSNLFSLPFVAPIPSTTSEFRENFNSTFSQSLRDLRLTWVQIIDRYRLASTTTKKFQASSSQQADLRNILATQDLRQHPRVDVTSDQIFAEVVMPDLAWKTKLPVREISRGGLLLQWEALPSARGQRYPIQLHLNQNDIPILTKGEIRYEISKQKKLFVGVKFGTLTHKDVERLESFLGPRRAAGEPEKADDVLDVFYSSAEEWRQEFQKNVVHGGINIRTQQAFTFDQEIRVRIHIPGTSQKYVFQGRVIFQKTDASAIAGERSQIIGVQLEVSNDQIRKMAADTL